MRILFFPLIALGLLIVSGCSSKTSDVTVQEEPLDTVYSEGVDTAYETQKINQIYEIFDGIKNNVSLTFSEPVPSLLSWTKDKDSDPVDVDGYNMMVEKTLSGSLIFGYFDNNGWERDENNFDEGAMRYGYGYKKENAVCMIYRQLLEPNDAEPYEGIEISCGILE